MNQRIASLVLSSFWWLLLLGVIDRTIMLFIFGFTYVGDDDGVIWTAAVDFGHGIFRWPYFYGQDYGPMLEALIAAPFVRTGLPPHLVMPIATSLLALLPYWSFAIWHHRRGRPGAAALFALMPIMLPVEFGLMTTITRGFVTGIAPLAALLWIMDVRSDNVRALFIGTTLSIAWFVNPNSLVFTVGFAGWYVCSDPKPVLRGLFIGIGSIPGLLAHLSAQAYCAAHRDRIVNTIYDWRMEFHAVGIPESLSMLDEHFAWLAPVIWPFGQLAGELLIVLLIAAIWKRAWPTVAGLTLSTTLIFLSFAFAKTHDGAHNVFFPLSRMFLALPLLLCWGGSTLFGNAKATVAVRSILLVGAFSAVICKGVLLPSVMRDQLDHQTGWVFERPVADLRSDEAHVRAICDANHVDLIVLLQLPSYVCPQFRAYLFPAIDATLPPTYLAGFERRYWQRDDLAQRVVPNVLLTAGDPEKWELIVASDPRFIDVSDGGPDQLHVIIGNSEPTDSLVARVLRGLNGP